MGGTRRQTVLSLCLAALAAAGCGVVRSAAEYGVSDPSRAALVIVDGSSDFQVVSVTLRSTSTEWARGLGGNRDGAERVHEIDPGEYELTVRYSAQDWRGYAAGDLETTFSVSAGEAVRYVLEGGDLNPGPGEGGWFYRPPHLARR